MDNPRLARALAGLPPEQERQFQTHMAFDPAVRAWRNGFVQQFGEMPEINNPDYDYRKAWKYGGKPEPSQYDNGAYHWPSESTQPVPPYAAPIHFKAPDHQTMWKQTFMDQFGVDPDGVQEWTPEMQAFMQKQIGRY